MNGTDTAVAPLVEIERRVQQQAKHQTIDLDTADGRSFLRELVRRQITQWNEDHKRGLRPMALVDVSHLAERAYRNLAEYGPLSALLG